MRRAVAILAACAAACGGEHRNETTVEIIRVAPMQLLEDSLEVTPVLDTSHNTPEQGQVALSIEVRVRNAGRSTRRVPAIGFRAVPEDGQDTTARWRFDITRRNVDSLRAGERASFGLTTSPASLTSDPAADGVYRIEAVFGDSTTGARAVPLGRIRLRPH